MKNKEYNKFETGSSKTMINASNSTIYNDVRSKER